MGNAEGIGEGAGVKASSTPEGNEREVAGIAAALDGNDADGFFHGGVDDADDAGGELIDCQATSLLLEKFLREAAGAIEIEREVSAKKTGGLEATKEKVGVGHGGLSAASVTDGTRIGAGGFRADAKNTSGVEAGEGASASADSVDVEHGNGDGEADNLGIGGGGDFSFDEGNVGGGASHVEGDDAVETAGAGRGGGADDASCRAGEDSADGLAGGGGECGDASTGLHDEDARGEGVRRPAFGFRENP